MSDGVDVEEFLQGFLAEADENLARITGGLAAIERDPGRSHARELGEVMRALHTLKGLAGMMGIEPIVQLTHAMETRLRPLSRGDGHIPSAALDPLLVGTRAIVSRIREVAQRAPVSPPPDALMADLERDPDPPDGRPIAASLDVHGLDPALAGKLSLPERAELEQALARGETAVSLRFAPSPAKAAAGITITTVRAGIERHGRIVRVLPRSTAPDEKAPGGLEFIVLATTAATLEALAQSAGVGAADVTLVTVAPAPVTIHEELDIDDPLDRASRKGAVRVDVARLDTVVELLAAVANGRTRLREEVRRLADAGVDVRALRVQLDDESRVLRRLRAALLELRMVPLRDVLEPLPLVMRGLRASTGKDVRLTVDVGDVELDKSVAERILPALIHLVRNAADHGIESREGRVAAKKPEVGSVVVRALARSTTHLDIEIHDDGAGIDPANVARKSGRPPPRTDAELLDILTTPGFSTREAISTTSGRGVGLDIVRRTIDQLGGALELENHPGHGTTWRTRVPLTVAMIDAFSCEAGAQRYLIPVSAVEAIFDVADATVVAPPVATRGTTAMGMVSTRGVIVPLISLRELLGSAAATDESKALLVQLGRQQCAFAVTRMLGRHEVIVRPLADPLVNVAGVAGTADLGDGRPTLVLDLRVLGAGVTRGESAAVA